MGHIVAICTHEQEHVQPTHNTPCTFTLGAQHWRGSEGMRIPKYDSKNSRCGIRVPASGLYQPSQSIFKGLLGDITAQQPQSKRYYKTLIKAMIHLKRRLCLCITNEQHNVLTPIAKHGQSLLEHPLITTEPTYVEPKSPTISSQAASDHQVQAQPSPSTPLPSSIESTKQHSCRSQSVSQSNTPWTMTPQQFSAMLDPDFLDQIETPEDITHTKDLAKVAAFIAKKAYFRAVQTEASQSITVPWACLRLINRSTKYIRCNMDTENDARLSPTSMVN
ncbi:predicted protein [Lichtheimia corymbifera JMRC:FSU:9682]|uniref:Uncharacterized protein n=1 Tax=Lichtheimia corymbifera JMRC:FSU:9682 TaxID=1263082 RepID=A0A068S1P9_9FUNG|nr:predicted protein [Lichtheimia corymbifera JMRC:FSU:9682]